MARIIDLKTKTNRRKNEYFATYTVEVDGVNYEVEDYPNVTGITPTTPETPQAAVDAVKNFVYGEANIRKYPYSL